MATINTTLCPTFIEAGITPDKIENKITKSRKAIKWYTGAGLSKKEREDCGLALLNLLNDNDPRNLGSTYDIAQRIGYPEPLVRKMFDEYLATGEDLDVQLKADGK
jgi:hypothetical protein